MGTQNKGIYPLRPQITLHVANTHLHQKNQVSQINYIVTCSWNTVANRYVMINFRMY